MEAKLTQQKGKNGKGPDALDWFLHSQSLAGGDGEAGPAVVRLVILLAPCPCRPASQE